MKKLALAVLATAAAIFGFGVVASAQSYSPSASIPVAPDAGGTYSVVYLNCIVGETVTFNQAQSTPASVTAPCVGVSSPALTGSVLGVLLPQQAAYGNATGNFTAAPTTPGTYTGTGVSQNGTATFSLTIPGQAATTTTATTAATGGQIPTTGSSGVSTTTTVAIVLLAVGAGLLIVAGVRRKQTTV